MGGGLLHSAIKVMVKVDETQVLLQGNLICRSRIIVDSFHTIFWRGNACRVNAVAEKVEGGYTKLALVWLMTSPY